MKNKNIRLGILLSGLNNLLFWYAPWLLYFLRYLTFSEVAVIQAIILLTRIVTEIPTGAISDLVGKKKTLLMSFLFMGIGELLVTFFPNFKSFVIAYIIISTGDSLYSGTMDAFIYDTLVENKTTNKYAKVLSKMNAVTCGAIAIACITGGFMFTGWERLPFLATAIVKFIGFFVTFFIDEPKVDTDKFSFKNFVAQTKKGFAYLFNKQMLQISILLVSFGAFQSLAYELLDDTAVIAFGYNAVGIGLLYSILVFLKIPFSLMYEKLSSKYKPFTLIIWGAIVLVLNYIFSPWIGVFIWTGLFLIKVVYGPIRDCAISELINKNAPSRIRTTTISTYEMIKLVPFLLLSGLIGSLMDKFGVKWFSFGFSVLLLLIILPQIILWRWKKKISGH